MSQEYPILSYSRVCIIAITIITHPCPRSTNPPTKTHLLATNILPLLRNLRTLPPILPITTPINTTLTLMSNHNTKTCPSANTIPIPIITTKTTTSTTNRIIRCGPITPVTFRIGTVPSIWPTTCHSLMRICCIMAIYISARIRSLGLLSGRSWKILLCCCSFDTMIFGWNYDLLSNWKNSCRVVCKYCLVAVSATTNKNQQLPCLQSHPQPRQSLTPNPPTLPSSCPRPNHSPSSPYYSA